MLSSKDKALKINLADHIYGTFAEIGAGQEVARYFFQAGGASGTVASTISAYDMAFSDRMYGEAKRYVCEDRLLQMMDVEHKKLLDILKDHKDDRTEFFTYANTVSARNYYGTNESHGWMGVRFQRKSDKSFSEVIIHVRMLDSNNIGQQQAIGLVGVNLVYASFFERQNMSRFVKGLMDNLDNSRLEIDMIRVSGEAFKDFDNRILSLQLVRNEMTPAVLFNKDGQTVQPSDLLYKKDIILLRGSFRPPTFVNVDMLESGEKKFFSEKGTSKENTVTITNITLANLKSTSEDINEDDFLARVDLLNGLGQNVMITLYTDYYRLNEYFARFKNERIRFILGIFNLEAIMDPKSYKHLAGGIMEAFGRLFSRNTKLFIYPVEEEKGKVRDCTNLEYPKHLNHLYQHLIDNNYLEAIEDYHEEYFGIWSRVVLRMVQNGEDGWEEMVPEQVVKQIKEKCLFGYPCEVK